MGWAPEHPLAMSNGLVLEHRRVAYNKYGAGTQTCNWCNVELEWSAVEVDHLDWTRTNNRSDNLVTSCQKCNLGRRSPKEEAAAKQTSAKLNEQSDKLTALIKRLNR
ncbi:HNH endonuclease signature motif containing protein [Sphingobium sp. LSP13-1-1.1]|uniref:HNH endonuclease signature motif containing protein n=1 Tax=Sphingobium sp. LSP13-1-1.1 TaxID=3135234 RepID=UPI0034491010